MKNFKNNPAAAFFPTANLPNLSDPIDSERPGVRINPDEVRNRRVQLLMTPSLYERLSCHCRQHRISINSYIHELLDDNLKSPNKGKKT